MTTRDNTQQNSGDQVEALLRQAPPRAVPPADDERAVRAAVATEWRSVVRKRRTRNRGMGLALAASVLVAVALTFGPLQITTTGALQVASVDKRAGQVYLLDNHSESSELPNAMAVLSGQSIETSGDSAVGLIWGNGGSLRIDENSRLEFINETSVFLHRGRIYFDSQHAGNSAHLLVETHQGAVTHVGTQYMASINGEQLVVSVREGRVKIDGNYFDETADAGKQVQMRGASRPVVLSLPPSSDTWLWTEALSPGIELDNVNADEFLKWVGRETGYDIEFASDAAEQLAAATRLVGRVQADPRTELRLRMMTIDLDYMIDANNGTITVRVAEQDRR